MYLYTFGILGVIVYSVCLFLAGLISSEEQIVTTDSIVDNSSRFFSITRNRIKGTLATPEHLHIDIAHKHFQKLAYKRELAYRMGILESSDDDFVPASIRHNGETYDVKLRLKGDIVDHLEGDKWSYRIKIKDDKALFGMRTLSVQHPKTRNFLAEWVYHQALRREGLISLRYDFINLTVNGKNLGIFALEEHFNKILVESNQRRQGPIIRFSEDQFWKQKHLRTDYPEHIPVTSASFDTAHIDAFESKSIAADSSYYEQFMHAITLLETFRNGERRARDVFDLKKLAMYTAISELIGAHHSILWRNMRFYYNPITARLEPIGFDGYSGELVPQATSTMDLETARSLLRHIYILASEDPLYNRYYNEALYTVSQPEYLASLMEDIKPEFEEKLSIIHRSFPDYEFPYDAVERNRRLLYVTINPNDGLRTHYQSHQNDSLTLDVGSTQPLSIDLHSLQMGPHTLSLEDHPLLPGRQAHKNIPFQQIRVALPESVIITDSTLATYTIRYHIPGSDSLFSGPILPYPQSRKNLIKHAIPRDSSTLSSFAFIKVDESKKEASIQAGSWTIEDMLIVPDGYGLRIPEGTSLDLVNSAAILVHGPVHLSGTAAQPIHIHSSDGTGQGFTVLNAPSPSYVQHTRFENLQHIHREGWALTGSVNFHEATVYLNNASFVSNKSEDALNIISSSFEMDSVYFAHTFSDAFDGDFTQGVITNSTFEHTGNDAIDVSGSTLTFRNVTVTQAGDKALSIGEYSQVEGTDFDVEKGNIGIASKDNSVATLDRIRISNAHIGVALYQKKPEFGPGSLEISGLSLENTEIQSLVEEGSLLLMNGELIKGDKKQVADQLY